jgi:IclR family transcriptional regulator, acetate operon repressor
LVASKTGAAEPPDNEEAGNGARRDNKATTSVLAVLSAFAADVDSFNAAELSLKLGMSGNMVRRALLTLADQGYLMRDPGAARYRLGLRVLELQDPSFSDPDLRTLCAPYLIRLQELTGETVRLAVRSGDSIVIVDGAVSRRHLASRVGLGAMFPLHVSPASRVILAHLSDEEIEAYLARNVPRKARTGATITDPDKLRADVRRTREQGYALGYGDGSAGAASVAFPVLADGGLHGSLVVVGPEERFRERLAELLPALQAVVREMNLRTQVYPAWTPLS